MFENSGEKIKSVAVIVFYITVVILFLGIIGAFIDSVPFWNIILYGGLGFIIAWVTTLYMVAFGDLVESNEETMKSVKSIETKMESIVDNIVYKYEYIVYFTSGDSYCIREKTNHCTWKEIEDKCKKLGKWEKIKTIVRGSDGKELEP